MDALKGKKGGRPAVAFYRVSSDDQEDKFSLVSQARLGHDYASKKGLSIVKTWSEVESASKENSRKHFFAMVQYIKDNGIKDIIFDKVDRAARGFKCGSILIDLVDDSGVDLHFTRDNLLFNQDSVPGERLRFYMTLCFGKFYVDNLKSEIQKGVSARMDDGFWCWKAPLGYLNWRDPQLRRAVVIPDPKIAPAISEIFRLYAKGNYTWESLIKILNAAAGKKYDYKLIGKILENPFYYGAMVVKGVVVHEKAKHEALIDKETWDACAKIRGIRSMQYQSNPRARQTEKPFMGLIRCGACAHAITGEAKAKANGKAYVYYHCANVACPEKSRAINQDKLHAQIVEAFKPFERFTPTATKIFVETAWQRVGDLDEFVGDELKVLEERRREAKAEIKSFFELKQKGLVKQVEYEGYVKLKHAVIEQIDIEKAAASKADHATYKMGLGVIELFTNIPKIMSLGDDLLTKARLAEVVLSNLSLKGGTLSFDYEKPFDDLLKLAGCRGWWG